MEEWPCTTSAYTNQQGQGGRIFGIANLCMQVAIKALGFEPSKAEIKRMIDEIDADK